MWIECSKYRELLECLEALSGNGDRSFTVIVHDNRGMDEDYL